MRRRTAPLAPALVPAPSAEVDSLRRGLELLRELTPARSGISLHALAARMALPRATLGRLAATLAEFGLVRTIPGTDRIEPDIGCLALGHALRSGMAALRAARPLIEELAASRHAQVRVCVRDRLQLLVLESAGAVEAGVLAPITGCAAGHAILWATESPLQGALLQRIREETPGALGQIYRSFQQLEESGVCTIEEPLSTAAPIVIPEENMVLAIAANARLTDELREIAARIESATLVPPGQHD